MANITGKLTHGGRVLEIHKGGRSKSTYSVERIGKTIILTKEGGETYEICVDGFGPSCDCPAALFRPHSPCRHVVALTKVGLIKEPKCVGTSTAR